MTISTGGKVKPVFYKIIGAGNNALNWYSHQLNHPSRVRRTLSLSVFAAIILFAILVAAGVFDPYPLRNWVNLRLALTNLGIIGALFYILLVSILPLYSSLILLIITGSVAFGPVYGGILAYIGVIINANLAFFLVKSLSIEHLWGKKEKSQRIKEAIQRRGYPIVLLLQLITVIPFVLINSAAGAAGIPWRSFMKATMIGILPCIILSSLIGEEVITSIASPRLYVAFVSILAACILLIALRRKAHT